MATKECPSCAMQVDKNAKECPVCGSSFESFKLWHKLLAILLLLMFLLAYIL